MKVREGEKVLIKVKVPETDKLKQLLERHKLLTEELEKNLNEINKESISMQIGIENVEIESETKKENYIQVKETK